MVGGEDLAGAIHELDAPADDVLDRFLPNDVPEVIRDHRVVAMVVSHDGAEWLPRTLEALAQQTRRPDRVVGVDAGSRDGSADLVEPVASAVVEVGRREGLADALRAAALAATLLGPPAPGDRPAEAPGDQPVDWYWIIHDECAPQPDCLEQLLLGADRDPRAAVLAPKAVAWSDPGLLVGIGHKWSPGTPVVERLESSERDQGQYDFDRPVYAAGSAGLLVRADVWEALDGFDPVVGQWAASYDFCRRVWGAGSEVVFVPRATVAHRQASRRGVRASAHGREDPRRAGRRGQLYLELTQASVPALPGRYLRAVLSTLLRTLALLLTREPEESRVELAGAWDVLGHPLWIARGRRRVRRHPVTDLTRPPQCRAYRGTATKRAVEAWVAVSRIRWRAPRRVRIPPAVWRPLAVAGVLAVASVLREPGQLFGSGDLQGGGLLPAPGAAALLGDYAASWHDTWFGSPAIPPAYLAVLAGVSVLALGSVDALLRIAVALAVPLAYLSAHASIGSRLPMRLRTGLALGWACLPAGVAAAGSGRISTLALLLIGPPAARAVDLWWSASSRGEPTTRPTLVAGTLLGILACFAPTVLLIVAVAAAVGWAVLRPPTSQLRSGLVGLGMAALVVAPWGTRLLRSPWLLLSDLGRNAPELGGASSAWGLAPGGPASVAWAGVPLVATAAMAAVAARPRRGTLAALAGAVLLIVGVAWTPPVVRVVWPSVDPASLWPGQGLLVAGGLLAVVVARTAATAPAALRPGLRAAGLVCVACLMAGWWVAPPGPTTVTADSPLPPVAALEAQGAGRPRALVLERRTGDVVFGVSAGPGAQLGDADALAGLPQDARFADLVQGLVSGAGGDVEAGLGGRGIRYVVFAGSPTDAVVAELDAVIGLRRLASSPDQSLWLVTGDPVRARLAATAGAGPVDVPIPGVPTTIDVVVHPQTILPRALLVAERADRGWSATLEGEDLDLTEDPAGMLAAQVARPGRLTVAHGGAWDWLGPAHLALVAGMVVLALPKRRSARVDRQVAA